jgi:predicted RNA polymerase sigma factor
MRANNEQLSDLLDRFADVSEAAARACAAGDMETVNHSLEVRESLMEAIREAAKHQQPGPASAELRRRLTRVKDADEAFERALASGRDEIGRQLAEIDQQRAAALQYQAPERRSSLDVRR